VDQRARLDRTARQDLHLGGLVTLALGAQRVFAGKHEHARGRLPREAAERADLRVGRLQLERDGTQQREQPSTASSTAPMAHGQVVQLAARTARGARRVRRALDVGHFAQVDGQVLGRRLHVRTLSPTGGSVSVPSSSKRTQRQLARLGLFDQQLRAAMVITSPAMTMRAPCTGTPLM
jgi:hypothetical protein